MKRIIFASLALMMLSLVSCNTANKLTKAEIAHQVQTALDARQYTITVDWMKPYRGVSRHVNSDYELKVNGDEMDSYLPYVGEAYHVPYGGGKGLNFKAPILNYTTTQIKNDRYLVEFDVVNEEDSFHYRMDIFTSGKATIDVWARERDPISFQGEMLLQH